MAISPLSATLAADDKSVANQAPMPQVAALCWRERPKGPQVLLVKSSRGRWILPKGWPMDGKTDAEAAKLEAWEEAGVKRGTISKAPVGSYLTQKRFDDGTTAPCHIAIYAIAVEKMTSTYLEAGFRQRKWMRFEKAARKVGEPGLSDILGRLQGLKSEQLAKRLGHTK